MSNRQPKHIPGFLSAEESRELDRLKDIDAQRHKKLREALDEMALATPQQLEDYETELDRLNNVAPSDDKTAHMLKAWSYAKQDEPVRRFNEKHTLEVDHLPRQRAMHAEYVEKIANAFGASSERQFQRQNEADALGAIMLAAILAVVLVVVVL